MSHAITIRLPEAIEKELEEFISEEHLSKSEAIRKAIKDFLFIRKFRKLRREILPYAEAAGLYTDEDVFNSIS